MRRKKLAKNLGTNYATANRDKATDAEEAKEEGEIEVTECVICLENVSLCGEPVVKLNESMFNDTVIKTCKCACDIHTSCAVKWVDMTQKCPICRTWCVINLNAGDRMVIFTPHQMEFNRFGACKRFIIKCGQVFVYIIVFIHVHLIAYIFIFAFFTSFL